MRRRAGVDFTNIEPQPAPRGALGGARRSRDLIAQGAANVVPQAAARIYNAPAVVNFDQTDQRYEGKSDNVENIYLPAADAAPKRAGIAQIWNWLINGELR